MFDKYACGPEVRGNVVGLSFDTTASTPVIVDAEGTPLALLPEFAEDPDAMFVLWKDHTALIESDRINEVAHSWSIDYTKYSGGTYSCEWVWAKMLHCLRVNENVRAVAYSWVENCDWITGLLIDNVKPETMLRSRCVALRGIRPCGMSRGAVFLHGIFCVRLILCLKYSKDTSILIQLQEM